MESLFFQKIEHGWGGLAAAWVVMLVLSCFYLGRERFHALGWPFTKFLKLEEEEISLDE